MLPTFLAFHLVMFTGLGHQIIEIDPDSVASIRTPKDSGHISKNVHCVIFTTDGKFVSVIQTCDEVHKRLQGSGQ